MKKILFVCGLAIASIAANAQLYVGGTLGLDASVSEKDSYEKTTATIKFAPEVGYSLTDKFDVGGQISFSVNSTTTKQGDNETEGSTTGWSIAPYVRYAFAEWGNFKVLAKASLSYGVSTTESGTTITEETSTFGLGIVPVLTYKLTDHFLLLNQLDFLGLGLTSTNVKDGVTTTSFNFNATSNGVLRTSIISIGFAYVF